MSKPLRGTIQNWKEHVWDASMGEVVVMGNIFGDEGRFEDGTFIRTSAIVKLDYENKKLETLNSVYTLGKEYGGVNLESLASLPSLLRRTYMDRPDLPDDMYYYSPTYGISGLLLYNYEESDKSLRERYLKLQTNK